MWRTMILVAALGGSAATFPVYAAPKEPTPESRLQEAQKRQQDRLQAVTKRGRLSTYQQLLGTGGVRTAASKTVAQTEAFTRDAAIDLAALGFTAADVKAFRARNVDLFDVVHRFFVDTTTTPTEQMLLADFVVIATAGEVRADRNRQDGFLSEIPFTVVKSLRGSRTKGDVIRVPRNSGLLPNGLEQRDFSDIQFTPGKQYLLVLSKNWYEQYVALGKKQPESSVTALPYLAFEVADGGTLLPGPRATISGAAPKDVKSVESELAKFSTVKNSGAVRSHGI